jgi:hypothetical protein
MFGRNPSRADTVLSNIDASQIHASIRWNGQIWEITDHSRNGTMVDGRRLLANTKTPLTTGQTLRFALGSNLLWRVVNLDPPGPMLLPLEQNDVAMAVALHGFHFLPDEANPLATVYLSGAGQWMSEDELGNRVLQDGDTVMAGPHSWKFCHYNEIEVTSDVRLQTAPVTRPVRFAFDVSQNEEHIQLVIELDGKTHNLGERTHHYSLLLLARQRNADAQRGMDVASQGWLSMEELARMLGLDVPHVNTQLFRSRNQIARDCADDGSLSNVIERRRGEVRFGAFHFRIVRGVSLEAEFVPPPSMNLTLR